MTQEEYWYWFCNIKDIGPVKMEMLLNLFKEPKNIFFADSSKLSKIKSINQGNIKNILDSKKNRNILKELDDLNKRKISFIYLGHKDYPPKLLNIYDRPFCLYVKGELPKDDKPSVAMIGSRNCSNYGKEAALKLAGKLAESGVQIISGFARGIDSYSQWGAIHGKGKCFGILGCGLDICYPRENMQLYDMTIQNGGIISEYPLGSQPDAWRFPRRNRLISGLADKLVVVEAKEKSGTLITVEHALEQGRDVFAVPGRVSDPLSAGCNKLIKEGAGILTDINDLLNDFTNLNQNFQIINSKIELTLEKDFKLVYSCVDFLPKNLQKIIEESGLKTREVIKILVELEMMDLIEEPVKNFYSKKT